MPTNQGACLYTTVRNVSGKQMTFGFLPPHGVTLAINEEFNFFGDLMAGLMRGSRASARRNVTALENALINGTLTILKTPSPILEDANHAPHAMAVATNGTLSAVAPCWTDTPGSLGNAN